MQVEDPVPESQSAPEPVDAASIPATRKTDAPTERVDTLSGAMDVDSESERLPLAHPAPKVEASTEVSESKESCPDIVVEGPNSDTGDDSSDVTEVAIEELQQSLITTTTSCPDDRSDVEQSPVSEFLDREPDRLHPLYFALTLVEDVAFAFPLSTLLVSDSARVAN